MAIEIGRLGPLQIGEEAADPGGEMLFEKLLLHPLRDRELTAG
jgi:hypothetical protein